MRSINGVEGGKALNSFLSRIGKALGGGSGVERTVSRHFSKQLGIMLSGRIAEYVEYGSKSSVLSDCSQQSTRSKWQQRHYIIMPAEGGVLKNMSDWRTDQLFRFGEVLAELDPITYEWGHFGTKKSPDWLRHVLQLWLGREGKNEPLQTLVDLTEEGGLGANGVVEVLFARDPVDYGSQNSLGRFAGTEGWLRDNFATISVEAVRASADVRVQLANAIGRFGLHSAYMSFLLDLASGPAKGARAAACQALTGADATKLEAAIRERYAEADATRRSRLVDAVAVTMRGNAADLVAELREDEKSTKVLAAMDRVAGAVEHAESKSRNPWQKDGPKGYIALDGEWVSAPPCEEVPGTESIPQKVLDLLLPQLEAHNSHVREQLARHPKRRERWWLSQHTEFSPNDALSRVNRLASGSGAVSPQGWENFRWLYTAQGGPGESETFYDNASVTLRHLVRLARVLGAHDFFNVLSDYASPAGLALQRRIENGADIRAINTLWFETGGTEYVGEYLGGYWYSDANMLPAEAWPIVLDNLDKIDEALGLVPQKGDKSYNTLRALKLIELMPKVPDRYRQRLMMLANESGVRIRELARKLLADAEGIEDAIALQLDDGKQDVRALAAHWLAQRGANSHIPAIRKRLTRERSEKARAQMISALEWLGDDTNDFFDQKAMIAEAEKGLKKAMPKGLEWFSFDALPALNWADGTQVDPILPKYWVVLTTRLKDPSGNALIDLWLDRLAPGDAHKLGWLILTGWIAQDTRMPSDAEANEYAKSMVDHRLEMNRKMVKQWPESADYISTVFETVFAQLKKEKSSVYLGSAADSKGMLALASRVEGSEAGPRIRSFLKNHGSRTSQAKALLDVLANIGTPASLQVLLQTADRLKQKSVQAHAGKLIEAVAERRGWSAGELADRTVPTAGLDEDGVLVLECGQERTYTARLDEEDKLALFNAAGKEVKALPPARMDEEKAEVAASKKALSKARKEVKQVVEGQTARFREAMCMERSWSSEDWMNYVASHPIVGRLAARLIWIGTGVDSVQHASFRPLGDGSCSDQNDEDIDPSSFAGVKLAHSTVLDKHAAKAWKDHLADYSVAPLFDQLHRDLPEITEETRRKRVIKDREGWMIETFRLRGAAAKLGYQRGPAEDGGWFMTYHRVLREAKLVAEIEFTGSMLPEENIPAALISLSFRKLHENGRFGQSVSFDKVPDVLLAETWRDYHDMAEKGTGFDPDWQKKAGL
jgi:hypothetical protein